MDPEPGPQRTHKKEEAMIARQSALTSVLCLGASIVLGAAIEARADVVTDWNQTAIRATGIAGAPVPVQARVMAMVHAAIFDAVNAIDSKFTVYAIDVHAVPGASVEAAAASAAHGILDRMYPLQKPITDAALAGSLTRIPDGPAKAEGLRLGQEVAVRLFDLRKDDGSGAHQTYVFGSGAGVYQPTPPMNAMPILPQWGNVKPFLLSSAKQFVFAAPPAPTSTAFAKDFNEIKRIGSANSLERTTEQTAIAIHWAGSEVVPFNMVARAVAAAKGLDIVENARLFALLNMSMADALIGGFEAKYAFNYWRPVTAIRNAGLADNAAISADAGWEPLLVTPPHPEYPCAHCLAAGAAVVILQHVFDGDKLSTSYIYPPLGILRRWDSFSEISKEVENARVWGGIHYRTSTEVGTRFGRQVAEFALKTQMQPRTH
jgi:hypothetical protein